MAKNVSSNPKKCVRCGAEYMPTSNRQLYCVTCQREINNQRCSERYYKTYQRKGYNQKRENNNNWKGGVGIYRQLVEGTQCERCGSTKNLCVHHKDRNRYNNDPSNLEVLCRRCHQLEHDCIKNLTRNRRRRDSQPSQE